MPMFGQFDLSKMDADQLDQLARQQMYQSCQFEHYEGGEATEKPQVVSSFEKSAVLGQQNVNRLTKTVDVEYLSEETIEVIVKDNQNLNEFSATVPFEKAYLPKLINWIAKRRFQVVEQAREDTILLRVDMFSF